MLGVCISIFTEKGQSFVKVCVIFDRHIEESLKNHWRILKRTGDRTVRYKISGDAVIENLFTKQFLPGIKSKEGLTKYLSMKLCEVCQNLAFTVSYEFICISKFLTSMQDWRIVVNRKLYMNCVALTWCNQT